jgi:adenosine/AMP kinase
VKIIRDTKPKEQVVFDNELKTVEDVKRKIHEVFKEYGKPIDLEMTAKDGQKLVHDALSTEITNYEVKTTIDTGDSAKLSARNGWPITIIAWVKDNPRVTFSIGMDSQGFKLKVGFSIRNVDEFEGLTKENLKKKIVSSFNEWGFKSHRLMERFTFGED